MATTSKGSDRRAQRTRGLLQRALIDLIREKTLAAVSVQEIAERAEVSRGTFYAHFADKYELVETIISADFRRAVSPPPDAGWNAATLRRLIRSVFDYFKTAYHQHHRSREFALLLEQAIQRELNSIILALLASRRPVTTLSPTMLAQMVSHTLFGAAIAWSQEPGAGPVETVVEAVLAVVMQGVLSVLPDEGPHEQDS